MATNPKSDRGTPAPAKRRQRADSPPPPPPPPPPLFSANKSDDNWTFQIDQPDTVEVTVKINLGALSDKQARTLVGFSPRLKDLPDPVLSFNLKELTDQQRQALAAFLEEVPNTMSLLATARSPRR